MDTQNSTDKIFSYEGSKVTFRNENGDVMVNLTEMSKPFKKQPKDWLRNKNTKQFLEAYSKRQIIPLEDLVQVLHGGYKNGTFVHEDIAVQYAMWLNPVFAIWVGDRVKELLTHGITATDNFIDNWLDNPDRVIEALQALKASRAANKQLVEQNQEMLPKAEFYDDVVGSKFAIEMKKAAKILDFKNIGRNKLFEFLRFQNILMRDNTPYQYYVDNEWFRVIQQKYDQAGEIKIGVKTLVYQKGLDGINKLLKSFGHEQNEGEDSVKINFESFEDEA